MYGNSAPIYAAGEDKLAEGSCISGSWLSVSNHSLRLLTIENILHIFSHSFVGEK